MKFKNFGYDEGTDMFAYLIVSVGVFLLTPFTIYKWGADRNPKDAHLEKHLEALRPKHGQTDDFKKLEQKLKNARTTPVLRRILIILTWCFLGFLAYRTYEKSVTNDLDFDPFEIFGINPRDYSNFEQSKKPIKSIYRKMSKEQHPDALRNKWIRENPDEDGIPEEIVKEFDQAWTEIVRAYKTLTNEAAFDNWIQYGNPDGRLKNEWGMALPKWLVEKGNQFYVLAAYGLVFVIIIPTLVVKLIKNIQLEEGNSAHHQAHLQALHGHGHAH